MTDKAIAKILNGIFSKPSLVVHTIWFAAWWFLPIPNKTNLLTNIVSLEAIYIGLLVGIQQLRHHDALKKHITKTLKEVK